MQNLTIGYFQLRESKLKAIEKKIVSVLDRYKEEAGKIQGNWTDEDREKFKDWNNYHDKHDKIQALIFENWSRYKAWHYAVKGFNVY
jgi:hypothetical protein